MNVRQLRQNGYKVSIKHVREFCGIHKVEEYDNFMTRGEYENARINGELRYDGQMTPYFYQDVHGVAPGKMPSYDKAVFSNGGWTEVTITTSDGKILKGKYSFNGKPFNKKLGTQIALQKALGSELTKQRQELKNRKVYPL